MPCLPCSIPLAMWVDYWELSNRLDRATQLELDAFYARWRGTYVEDRLRNDWLLELGRRQDWQNFAADFPSFRMNDDREVTCYALLTEHLAGRDVASAAREAWMAQRDSDDGCALLARNLHDAKVLDDADIWRKARASIDAGRLRAAQQAAALLDDDIGARVKALSDDPVRFLVRKASSQGRTNAELATLALMRMAANDPDAAAGELERRWERALPPDLASWAWATVAKHAAIQLEPDAPDLYRRAERIFSRDPKHKFDWPDDTMAWKARAAMRADDGRGRWQQVLQAIDTMSADEQREPTWVYWKARSLNALADDTDEGRSFRAQAQALLESIATRLDFYGALAAEALGRPLSLPAPPAPLTDAERAAAENNAGLSRALQLIAIGLRNEGVREWNFTLRGMNERELLAAAQLACDRQVWDRCINTSDRTRHEIDMAQRFPTPFRDELVAQAKSAGIDPAYVYGLIRQESRFVMDARSGAGASGLMQIMPATARWTARKLGMPYTPDLINHRETNLRLGTGYLKLVLDRFDGSQALAAAAYNAGPNRLAKWRDGPVLETAVWTENIPFGETREYVKRVLSNASIYAAMLDGSREPSLRARLDKLIGPAGAAPDPTDDLP